MEWMISLRRQTWAALAVLAALASGLHAQRPQQEPHIGYVFPAGGQAGSSFDVTVGGQYLKDTSAAHLSGSGVRVQVVKYYKPLTQGEFGALRRKLDDARDKLREERKDKGKAGGPLTLEMIAEVAGVTKEQLKEMELYRQRESDPKRQPNAQLAEEVTLHVELDAKAAAEEREVRLITPSGMSNPLWFQVSPWAERRETEPNDKAPNGTLGDALPLVVNGQIMPGDVDRFAFRAPQGARLVISASARELIPYLADAVPGWFQAVLAVYRSGEEVACAGSYYFRQDPVIYYETPEAGEYVVEIRDSLYRGREDFVYRIAIGELPFLTGVFPLGGRAGTQVAVELTGWNLPVHQLTVDAIVDRRRPLRWYTVRQTERVSVRVPLAIDMFPECLDQEPNNDREHAQAVTLPIIVNGRIDQPGDCDVFRFEAQGRTVAEVYARRLGSPVDSILRLTDATGQEIASNDDHEDKAAPLLTHHADSRILTTLTAAGTYYLRLGDAQHKGGRDYAYRLHIRRPRPDFELRVVPSSIIARPGSCVPITVYALKRDGFDDDIGLSLEDAPPGFSLSGGWVPSGQDKVRLTLTVPPTPTQGPVSLQMEGLSRGRDRRVSHLAIPADTMMQAFAYQHLIPAKDWTVFVSGREFPGPRAQLSFERSGVLQLVAGGSARLRAVATGKSPHYDVRLELSDPPDGITIESMSPDANGLAAVLAADAKKVKPGLKGNLLFHAFRERTAVAADGKPAKPLRTQLGLLPAVPFEVLPPKPSARQPRR